MKFNVFFEVLWVIPLESAKCPSAATTSIKNNDTSKETWKVF